MPSSTEQGALAASRIGEEVEIRVRREKLRGWTRVSVGRSLEAAAGSFEMEVTSQTGKFPLKAGDAVQVWTTREELLATGHVDRMTAAFDGNSTTITVAGRDRTADLVDCSIDPASAQEWFGRTAEQLIREIASPFQIGVVVAAQDIDEPIEHFATQPGETAWSAVGRLGRLRGILIHSNPEGDLVLARPAVPYRGAVGPLGDRPSLDAVVPIQEGANVLGAQWEWNLASRFRTYVVRGQGAANNQVSGLVVTSPEGRATDPGITRFRPLVILAESQTDPAHAADRAAWEAAFRAARSLRLTVQMLGWRQAGDDSRLWQVNELVDVRLPSLAVRAEMLINSVTLELSESGGQVASLSLVRKGAYDPEPVVENADSPLAEFLDDDEAL